MAHPDFSQGVGSSVLVEELEEALQKQMIISSPVFEIISSHNVSNSHFPVLYPFLGKISERFCLFLSFPVESLANRKPCCINDTITHVLRLYN